MENSVETSQKALSWLIHGGVLQYVNKGLVKVQK